MEFLALHKIVLLVTAWCAIEQEGGTFLPSPCQNMITRIATTKCDLNKDEYHVCYGKIKKYLDFKKGFTFNADNANIKLKPLKETSLEWDGE